MNSPFMRCSPLLALMYFKYVALEGEKLMVLRFFGENENANVFYM